MGWLRNPAFIRLCRIVMGVLLVAASLAKLGDLQAFSEQVHNFRLLPIFSENLVALTLPWIELMAGLAMFLNIRGRSGAVVSTVLMGVFTVAVVIAMSRGLDFECGCFGTADASRVGLQKVTENLAMLVVSFLGTRPTE